MFKGFVGCGTALVTPFRKDLSLDEETYRRLVRRQIDAGINFLVPCGTTGESPTLSHEEYVRVIAITLEEAKGKVPVLAGAGGYDTRKVIQMAREVESMGADGILSVTPYYNKPTQEGLYHHYKSIAAATSLPVILYNVPPRTNVNIDPATVRQLSEIENIIGVKEASGNISQITQVIQQTPENFIVLSGDDAITLPVIAMGGRGIISVAANEIPAEMKQLAQLCLSGDFAGARALQRKWQPLLEVNFIETNPTPVKAAMAEMGLLESVFRLPLIPPRVENLAKIRTVLESLAIIERGLTLQTAVERLEKQIEVLFDAKPARYTEQDHQLFRAFKDELNAGRVRSAEPDSSQASGWRTNAWVKKGILIGFRMGVIVDMSIDPAKQPFIDKDTYPVKRFAPGDGVRIVPGGSSIRDGCYIGRDVVCMPPMFVNAGAYVGDGTMVDSHALVGSCAQVGRNCHISAASQIGGVLEPVGALPVIIEDEVLVGGNCGIYEGTIVKRRAVLGTGTILNRSTPVYDIVREKVYAATETEPLIVPEDAVVVAGSRAVPRGMGKEWGISLYTPVIVKYRDSKTDAKIQLEDMLR